MPQHFLQDLVSSKAGEGLSPHKHPPTNLCCFLIRVPINIFFMPTLEGDVNFNLICDVKWKSQPLCLNVKATGHTMNVTVRYEKNDGVITELDQDQVNLIHFQEVREQWKGPQFIPW